ncbi:MAG: hypothetical protein KatS3mg061_2157 [Dehalococcoidia bacterium]|nr:MAG: hypothetical protein KatS3mg061_2157 [Dehalococcoidia bacterium]
MVQRRPAVAAESVYTRDRFLAAMPARLRAALPPAWQEFRLRRRWNLLQFSYGNPRVHYEIWLQPPADLIELGLHLEADAATNEALLLRIAHAAHQVREALGPRCDLEAWTASWRRVHTVLPLTPLDEAKLTACVDWLARCISTLQPLIEREDG